METVREWLDSLRDLELNEGGTPALRSRVNRVLFPGFASPFAEGGFLLSGNQAPFQPYGRQIVVPSVVQWSELGAVADGYPLDGMPSAIGALVGLAVDRRVEVVLEAPVKYEDLEETIFFGYSDAPDRRLVSPLVESDISDVLNWMLGAIASVPKDDADVLLRATQLHYGATLVFDLTLEAAYTLVVAGLEVLSRQYGEITSSWADWDQAAKWDEAFVESGLSAEQATAMRGNLLRDKQLRLRQTFAEYVATRLPDDFWEMEWTDFVYQLVRGEDQYSGGYWSEPKSMSDRLSRDRRELRSRLLKSYDARSGFVHAGSPGLVFADHMKWEIPNGSNLGPIPFAILRSILRRLIIGELEERAADIEVPPIWLRHSTDDQDSGG